MRRSLAALVAAGSLALGGAVVVAGPAAAAAPEQLGLPADPAVQNASDRSVLGYCSGSGDHPGAHQGWPSSPGVERRNLGGRCMAS